MMVHDYKDLLRRGYSNHNMGDLHMLSRLCFDMKPPQNNVLEEEIKLSSLS